MIRRAWLFISLFIGALFVGLGAWLNDQKTRAALRAERDEAERLRLESRRQAAAELKRLADEANRRSNDAARDSAGAIDRATRP